MSKKQKLATGKDHAKFNKRQRFYNKFLRLSSTLNENDGLETLIPITMNKKSVFPEYDDISLIFLDHAQKIDNESLDSEKVEFEKDIAIALPFIDEAYFLANMVMDNNIELVCQETLENDEGNQRKGSISTSDSYNYQAAYNWGLRILNQEKLNKTLEKEAENPTTYKIQVKMKKIERNRRFIKPWRPQRTRKR